MPVRRRNVVVFLAVQAVAFAGVAVAWVLGPNLLKTSGLQASTAGHLPVPVAIHRKTPLRIAPLYDRPDLVSDADLAAVLEQVQPRFDRKNLAPNFVEHALRIWGVNAQFQDPAVLSGADMTTFLTDHRSFIASWGQETMPLLIDRQDGLAVRWTKEPGGSVHHDHWLASLTEAGISLDHTVYGPSLRRGMTIENVVEESVRDFRLDEREAEWTAMAFGLWFAPETHRWTGGDGRRYSFDLIAQRLMRGQKQLGVCVGTHRVYSLAVLLRLDEEYKILSPDVRQAVWDHLASVRDAIAKSQFPDGHWPSNWPDAELAVEKPIEEELHKKVIATGHHLEWMAIAPPELHVSDEQLKKACDWVIKTTVEQTPAEILQRYTFFSHVGNALALWRHQHPASFWQSWEQQHPFHTRPKREASKVEVKAAAGHEE
ncbi:hypothetical protein [Planctomyces sp. SH-PL14]|uniref:hypothetical protein n=1 Tax=Planctomyces sp. SH-PL14 TaxID=1632864 RepID=UPI00078E55C5|nr:hypothetical protein [Planctomyces sp. SH-PL14]AMV16297.1 hypothetical protein VT03_00305 [Planctomyces sp. SH-PL14]